MTCNYEEELFCYAIEIVKRAGNLVRDAFTKPIETVGTKSSATDFVTETDQAVEELIIREISYRYPEHKFIGEESAATTGKSYVLTDEPTWIIDPIDGTTNFVHRVPFIGICVGLAIKKQLRVGIVYNPITEELYTALAGKGAYKNGFPIHVSSARELRQALVCQTLGQHNIPEKGQKWLDTSVENQRKALLAGIHGHRTFGAASINMMFVAQGSIDAYVEYGLHSWDMAAAVVIIREAGGVVIDPTGSEFNVMNRRILCASTKELAGEFSTMLSHIDFDPE